MGAEQWINPAVAAMRAYPVKPMQEGALRLSDMECPQDIDPALRDAWLECLRHVAMNRYPRPDDFAGIEAALRRRDAIPAALPMIFGNGSDELIQIVLTTVAQPGRVVLAPAPTFVMYQQTADILGMNYIGVDLNADFSLNLSAMLNAIAKHRPAVIFLADPNNPTGNTLPAEAVRSIVEAAPGLVVLDEAYGVYAESSQADLAAQYDHVVVIRTLSKIGYAGVRFGYAFGAPQWMDALNKVKPPYNVNVLTLASVDFALAHEEFIKQQTTMILEERRRMQLRYQALPGVEVMPSATNFLVLRMPQAATVYEALNEREIWVKKLDGMHTLLRDCLRITVSNAADNERCFAAISNILGRHCET